MPSLIHKLRHFIKELKKFSYPSAAKGERSESFHIEQIHDQLAYQTLINLLEDTIEDKDDDWDISFVELVALQRNCKKPFFNETLQKLIANDILPYCNLVLEQRNTILINLLDLIYTCKVVTDISFMDSKKINPKLVQICRKLYETEDVILFFQLSKVDALYAVLHKSACFSQELFLTRTAQQQNNYEAKLTELRNARKNITPDLNAGFAKLRQESYHPIFASSAPVSPLKREVPTPRLYSLPNSPKSHMTLGDAYEISTTGPMLAAPKDRQGASVASTSSTLLLGNLSDEFYKMTLGPSSKSEDESDEKRMKAKKK